MRKKEEDYFLFLFEKLTFSYHHIVVHVTQLRFSVSVYTVRVVRADTGLLEFLAGDDFVFEGVHGGLAGVEETFENVEVGLAGT